jgi:hypothetical protein
VPVKRTAKPFELVHSDVCGFFSTQTLGDNQYYTLFIDNYTSYTSVWLLPIEKARTGIAAYRSHQAQVDWLEYEIKLFQCNQGWGEDKTKNFRDVLAACGTMYKPGSPYAHHNNAVEEWMICRITDQPWVMITDSQAHLLFWGEAVNTAVDLHQRSLKEGVQRITTMAINQRTKRYMRCCKDLPKLCTILMAMKYHFHPLSTICIDLDAMPVVSFRTFSAARATSAQGQYPAWW